MEKRALILIVLIFCSSFIYAQTKTTITKPKFDELFTIKKNDTLSFSDGLRISFLGHGSKIAEEGVEVPLILVMHYSVGSLSKEKIYSLFGRLPYVWSWKNYLFVVTEFEYDASMKMKVAMDYESGE
ncbi:MAG: hypothetical protein HXX09_06640 [Bacteroidetes bacterium]|nr:hypothetical protein [Bacteroidota bacterium]